MTKNNNSGSDLKNELDWKSILIVEDDHVSAELLMEIFESINVNLIFAVNGEDAVKLVAGNPYINLVLMDMRLPGISGYQATKEIKKLRPELPVIAQTAYALDGDREKALQTGCDAYISKPIVTAELMKLVKSLL